MRGLRQMRSIMMTPSSLRMVIMALCLLVAVCIPAAATAAVGESPVDIRATIADAQFSRVALVDQKTPTPETKGKDVLFIDGKYLKAAGDDVFENVKSLLAKGMPVVVLGDGYLILRDRMPYLPYSEDYVRNGDRFELCPVAVCGVKLYPGQQVSGEPVSSFFNILGNKLNSDLISEAKRMSEKRISNSPASVGVAAVSSTYPAAGPEWQFLSHKETNTGTVQQPYGRINMDRYWYTAASRTPNMDPTRDYRHLEMRTQAQPGQYVWGNSWKNHDLWVEANVGFHRDHDYQMTCYSPDEDRIYEGEYTISVTPIMGYSASWTHDIYKTTIHPTFDMTADYCKWWCELKQDGNITTFDSAAGYNTPTGVQRFSWLFYTAQYVKHHWYGPEHHKCGEYMQIDYVT